MPSCLNTYTTEYGLCLRLCLHLRLIELGLVRRALPLCTILVSHDMIDLKIASELFEMLFILNVDMQTILLGGGSYYQSCHSAVPQHSFVCTFPPFPPKCALLTFHSF